MPKKLKSIYLTEEVWSQLKHRATMSGSGSTNKLIAQILDEYLNTKPVIKTRTILNQSAQIKGY
jgi:hypothetical protein